MLVKKVSLFCSLLIIICFFMVANAFAQESDVIKLPAPRNIGGMPLMDALSKRQSVRSFSDKDLSLDIMSDLLWAAFGINRKDSSKRTAPSAHNDQEIDIYVAIKRGVFIYNAQENELAPIIKEDIREFVSKQDFTQVAPVSLIYVADLSKQKDSEEIKDFYSAVDTGFISQNVYLFCASKGLATVVINWINKEDLAKKLNLKSTQKIILAQPIGYPSK